MLTYILYGKTYASTHDFHQLESVADIINIGIKFDIQHSKNQLKSDLIDHYEAAKSDDKPFKQ